MAIAETRTTGRIAASAARRRWTVTEYAQMGESAVLGEDERVELIDGEVIAMAPESPMHSSVAGKVQDALRAVFGGGWMFRGNAPLAIAESSMPLPDLAVVRGSWDDGSSSHPQVAALVVEISITSLAADRDVKAQLYAAAGIPEYWIVNLVDGVLEVYRDPIDGADGARYGSMQTLRREDTVAPLAVPGASVAVDDLLPRA